MSTDYPFPEAYSEEEPDAPTLARGWSERTAKPWGPVYDYPETAPTMRVPAPIWAPVAAPTVAC